MKQLFKNALLALGVAFLCLLVLPVTSKAASNTPDKVTGLKAVATESSVTLTWTKQAKVTGYYVYQYNTSKKAFKRIAEVGKNAATYTVTDLKPGKTQLFRVSAYKKVKQKIYRGAGSASVVAKPEILKPGALTLSRDKVGNKYVQLSWTAAANATGYYIYQIAPDEEEKYTIIGTTDKTSVKVKKLTNGTTYRYRVRAYRTVNGVMALGDPSEAVWCTPYSSLLDFIPKIKTIHSMYYHATLRSSVTATSSNGKKVSLPAGSTVTVTERSVEPCIVQDPNDASATIKISKGNLKFTECITDYTEELSKEVAEAYVNIPNGGKGYNSRSKYLIWIHLPNQHFYVFEKNQQTQRWELIKNWLCATGRAGSPSPKGFFAIGGRTPRLQFDAYSYSKYVSFYQGGNGIHSWLYYTATNGRVPDGERPGMVGAPASHGCIRIEEENAKWVYDNAPIGTTVIIC